ncbi:MAG: VanW family protein [Chloroflexaceae bacterium]
MGRIDASNGFVEGYAIVQNRTQLEWGGGICQDSTTYRTLGPFVLHQLVR